MNLEREVWLRLDVCIKRYCLEYAEVGRETRRAQRCFAVIPASSEIIVVVGCDRHLSGDTGSVDNGH